MKRTTKRFTRHTSLAGQKRGMTQREATEDHLAVYGLLRALSLSREARSAHHGGLLMRLLTISAVIGAGLAGWSCLGSRLLAVVSVTAPADTPIPLLRPLGPVLLRR